MLLLVLWLLLFVLAPMKTYVGYDFFWLRSVIVVFESWAQLTQVLKSISMLPLHLFRYHVCLLFFLISRPVPVRWSSCQSLLRTSSLSFHLSFRVSSRLLSRHAKTELLRPHKKRREACEDCVTRYNERRTKERKKKKRWEDNVTEWTGCQTSGGQRIHVSLLKRHW